jgi:hypothetical protein
VGVGSVGTRAWVLLLIGHDADDPLFLQIKEAGPSVLEPIAGASEFETHGQRVVEGQRLMQAASDVFLGWLRVENAGDSQPRDYYVRQLWDNKSSAPVELMGRRELRAYAEVCGSTLARAHARSGDRNALAEYMGRGDHFDRAVVHFAESYADQNEDDHAALVAAVQAGEVAADTADSVI